MLEITTSIYLAIKAINSVSKKTIICHNEQLRSLQTFNFLKKLTSAN